MNLRFFVALSIFVACCNGYKVLFLAPMNGQSHFMFMSSFVKALLNRGHDVTFLTSNSLKHLKLANYTEVLIDPPLNMSAHMNQTSFIEKSGGSIFSAINDLKNFPRLWNTYALENANVQKFIHSTGLKFDVIVMEEFFMDSFLMFGHKFKAPIVTICPFGITEFIDRQQGLLSPPSVVPHWMLPFSDNMSFRDRCFNTVVTIYDWLVRKFAFLPTEEAYTRKHFAHLAPLPTINDLVRNVSLVLVNTHRAIAVPRPSMPNVIPIGGAHIKSVKPLPKDIKTFLDESKHGVIYFSLGSVLQSSKLPKELIQTFLKTFKKLKQRVLWKYEDSSLSNIPSNVMIRSWMPQNDILAHPNVVLFISHGGMFGTTESLYHGVPLLLIPFFGDQFRNAYRIDMAGYGKFINFREITIESLTKLTTELISDKSYLNKAKQTSAIFKDNLVNPMDEAMFWIEHVWKFKGAEHLKSHAVNMSWFSYLLFDVLAVAVIGVSILVYVICYLAKALFSKKKSTEIQKKKRK